MLRRQRGATLVEYAFIVMCFLLILLGITAFGHALYVYHHINNLAKEATRYASVRGALCNNDSTCTAVDNASGTAGPTTTTDIKAYLRTITSSDLDTTKFTYNVCGTSDTSACAASPTICSSTVNGVASLGANYPGCTVSVQIGYVYNFIFPLMPTVTTKTAPCTTAGFCLSSESQMTIVH
jgi:Flp pilus assembly protein TadG